MLSSSSPSSLPSPRIKSRKDGSFATCSSWSKCSPSLSLTHSLTHSSQRLTYFSPCLVPTHTHSLTHSLISRSHCSKQRHPTTQKASGCSCPRVPNGWTSASAPPLCPSTSQDRRHLIGWATKPTNQERPWLGFIAPEVTSAQQLPYTPRVTLTVVRLQRAPT